MIDKISSEVEEQKSRHHLINVHVGSRMRLRRMYLKLSLAKLANALEVKSRQVQIYESGKQQLSSTRLYIAAKFLDVPVSFFFDDMIDLGSKYALLPHDYLANSVSLSSFTYIRDIECEVYELVTAFYKIENRTSRKVVIDFLKLLNT